MSSLNQRKKSWKDSAESFSAIAVDAFFEFEE